MSNYPSYTSSQAFSARGSLIQYSTNPPSVAYTPVAELKNIGFSGAKYDLADITNMASGNFKEWLPTLADAGEVSIAGNYVPNSAAELAVIGMFNNATLATWEIKLPAAVAQGFPTTLGTFTFLAYVSSIDYGLDAAKEATISLKLKITGAVSFSAGS